MKNNNTVDTAKNGQTTTKTQPERVQKDLAKIQEIKNAKKSKTPTVKVTLLKETEARRKAREEQYKNFRVNALKRRCKRMGLSDEDTGKYIEKLLKQLASPNSYRILIMFASKDKNLVVQALKKEDLVYNMMANSHFFIEGDQEVLDTLQGIMPPSAKIYPYVKKKDPVIPEEVRVKAKKPTNNTDKKKAEARTNRKNVNKECKLRIHKRVENKKLNRKPSSRPNRNTNKTKVRIGKRAWLKARSTTAILKLSERIAKQKAITVQLKGKKPAEGSKTFKKAA